ncbi:MAG TPA: hypothetical protein H9747_09040 [Candidatus Blautia stercorigallinarum]|uniref:Uncharacterized protein n=1 Tax=Candidatus Blautia stercorigallinarum TaxID=2838501 RepID=A0A9D1TFN0_9FIRM|nr:hypothetical protein [Candidatus Blautia stercorigallinarum]
MSSADWRIYWRKQQKKWKRMFRLVRCGYL